jgi:hypothetical protein
MRKLTILSILACTVLLLVSASVNAAPPQIIQGNVTVTNTPLPVSLTDSKRDNFTVTLPLSEVGIGGAIIGLSSAAIVETVSAYCQCTSDSGAGYVTIQTKTAQTPPGLTATPASGVPYSPTLNSGLLGYWPLSPFPIPIDISGYSAVFMPPTAVGSPVGTEFTLYVTATPQTASGAKCFVSLVLRYVQ